MSFKGQLTVTSFLDWDKANMLIFKLEKKGKWKLALLVAIGIYTGLRIGDILKLRWSDLNDKKEVTLIEQKTKKHRTVTFHSDLTIIIEKLQKKLNFDDNDIVFINRYGTKTISIQFINKQLKEAFKEADYNIGNVSSHFLRKTFGRRVWDRNNKSEESLIKLSEVFNHSSIAITKRYLGIRQEEIADVYLQL